MNNKERDEKFLKSWLKKKISITTSTVVSFLITGAIGGGAAYGANAGNRTGQGTIDSVAVGTGSNSTAGGVAVGKGAQATGNLGAVAVGVEATTREYGVAIGYKAGEENGTPGPASHSNITIGANTRVGVKGSSDSVGQSIAIGSSQGIGAWAKGTQAIAIGSDTIAEGDSSVAIGGDDIDRAISKTKSYVKKSYDKNDAVTNTAVNNQSLDDIYKDLTGNTTGLGGYRGTTAGEASVALGVKAAAGDLATALGTMSEAKGINSLALGTGALATQANAVAIGAGSSTDGLKAKRITDANVALSDGTTVNFANFAGTSGVTEGDMVSFGTVGRERQLKNIAPGELSATSTDAATGSQLFSVAKKLSEDINSKFRYVSINSNDAGNKLNDGATVNNAIAIGPNASTKVASAISLGDGANVEAGPTKDSKGRVLVGAELLSGSGVAIGKSATAVQAGIAIGDTSSTVTSGIAIGREAKVNNKYETASGSSYAAGDSQDGHIQYDRVQNPDNLVYSSEPTLNDVYNPDRYNGQGIAIGYKAESNMFGTSLGNSAVAKQGGLALGTFSKATGVTATAIGLGANSSGARGISMGRQASATTADSVAIGTGARGGASSAGGSVAVGGGAAATGTQAIAIGGLYGNDLYSSSATKDGAGNLTKNTQASGEASIAMGVNTKATGTKALAMGSDAQATGKESTAIGINAKATGVQAITMGSTSEATAEKAIAIGAEAKSRASESVAIGSGTVSNRGIAIGKNSTSGGFSSSISLGTNATSNYGGIAIGENATAQGNSIVIGSGTRTPGSGTVVIGDDAGIGSASGKGARGENSIAIGKGAGKNSDANSFLFNTITIGAHSKVGETGKAKLSQSIAIGGVADKEAARGGATWAKGDQSIAIGGDVKSLGDSSVAIGGDDLDAVSASSASYTKKIFDKNGTQTSAQNISKNLNDIYKNLTGRTEGLGTGIYRGTNSGQGAVALGVKSEAGDIALAIGTLSEAKGINSVAIGTGAQTPQANAVAIGGGSTTNGIQGRQITDADITLADGSTMNYGGFAGATNVEEGSMVSFGRQGKERQLKHIAPGEISATSTDGINGSQLYSVAKKLGEGWKADAGGNKIGASTATSVKPGNTVVYSAGSNLQVKQTIDATNGKQTYEYSLNKDLTGLDSVTTKKLTVPGTGGKDTVIDNNGINAGGNKITNVAAGTNPTDVVNKSQLDKIGDNEIKLGGNSGTTAGQKLSQNNGLKFNIVGANGIETSASGTDVTVKLDNATKSKIDKVAMPMRFSGDDYDSADEANTTIAKGLGERLEIVGGAIDLAKGIPNVGTFKNSHGQLEIGLAKSLTGLQAAQFLSDPDNPDKGYSTITGDGYTITPVDAGGNVLPEISITKDGINAGNKTITNVAPGVNGTDAVNKNQLDQKIGDNTIKLGGDKGTTGTQNLSQAGGLQFNIKGGDGLETSASGTDVTVQLDTVTKQKLNKAVLPLKFSGDDYDPFDEVSTVVSKELGQKLEIVGGADTTDPTKLSNNNIGTMVNGTGKVNIKLAKELKDLTSAEFKTPAGDKTVINGDGLTVTPVAPGAAPISVTKDGINAGNKTITNVAPGTISATSKDAINGSQFHGLAKNTIQLGGDNATTTNTQTLDKTGGIKFDIVGANGITTEAKDGKVTVSVDASKLSAGNSKLSYTANGATPKKEVTLAQGLNFSDGVFTEAEVDNNGVVKYNVLTDSVSVDTDGKITWPTADGVATAKDVASALTSMGWKATAGTVSATEGTLEGTVNPTLVHSGEQVTFVAGKNLTVSQDVDTDGNHKYTYKLDKNLKDLDSVTSKTITVPGAPGTNDVVIGKDGISAGNKPITNVADGVNGKDAVNKSQLDKIGENKIKLGGDNSTVTAEQKLSQAGGLQFNIKGANGIETSASGTDVTVKLDAATRGKIDNAADKNLSNLTPAGIDKIKDTAAWKVKANNNTAETVKGGDEVVFKDGAGVTITQRGKEFTIAADTSKISKDTKISYTANGAAPKKEVSLADGFNFEDGTLTTATVDTAGKVKYDVKTSALTTTPAGKVTVPTTDGVATAKDVANAINNSGWKANAGGNVDGTSASTLVKSGDEVVFKAGDNLTVKQDLTAGKQEYTYKLNKDLTGLDSVTSKTITVPGAPGTNDVVIGKDGINAGNKPITNVADGVNGKDAVNKSQLDKIGENKIKLGGDNSTVTAEQKLSQAGGLQFNIKGANGIETSASGTDVTVKLDAATRGKIDNAADKNLSNLTPAGIDKIKDTAAWKVKANNNAAETVKGGDEVVFKDGAGVTITQRGKEFTIAADTSKISKDTKISYTANGAAPKKEVSLADGFNFEDGTLTTATVDTAGKVKYDVKTSALTTTPAGKVTVPTTDGVATAKDVANAINNSGWKANAGGNVDGTSASTLVKSGDEVVFKAGDNLTVKQDLTAGKQEYTYKLNKDLTGLDSVTSKTITVPGAPGTNDVVIGKDGINAGNKPITNVADGVNGKDAVNKSQLDKIGDNEIKLGGDNTTVTAGQKLSQTGGLKFNIKGANGIETSAAGTDVTVKLDAATRGKIDNAADKNLSNLTPAGIDKIKDTAAWKVKANNNAAETVKGGDEVVFKDGAGVTITQRGKEFTIAADTSKISKDTKISYTANGAAPKKEVSLADGFNFEDGTLTTATVDTAGKVKYDVKTSALTTTPAGKVTVPTTDGVATAKDVANAINNSGWKANAGGNVDGTSASTLVKSGDEVVFKAGDNLTVKQDLTAGKQEYTYKLNKDLTGLDSVTSKTITVPGAPGTNDVVIGKDGINAGNKPITNVADGVNGKDAVNKSQLDKIGDNEIKLGGDNTTVTAGQKLSQTGGLKFNIKGANGIETSAAGTDVTVKLDAATRGKIDNAADKNLSNLTPAGIDKIKDTAAWKVKANNNAAETVKGGDEVVFKDGAGVTITQRGKEFTIAADTSKISKDTKISYTANGAAPKKEVSLADGFNFEDGTLTTATVDTAGKVKYDVKTSALTTTPAGKVTVPTTDGVATAKDVANAINNSGWKANAGGNVDGTSASTLVKSGDEVVFKAGDNLTVKQDLTAGKQEYTYKLNKDLTGLDSVTSKTITVPGAPGTNDVVIGKDGISAGNKVIKDVAPGVNGTDAVNKNQLDTTANNLINKGMNFSADDYDPATANTTVSKKLGERLEIVGGADKTKLSNDNIGSVVDNTGKINVKLAKELKDLTSAEFKTPAGDKTVINGDGLTVTPVAPGAAPISVTKDGINAGNKTITNVAPGVNGTDAVNKNQLDQKIGDNKIKLGGDTGTTATQDLSKAGGLQFNVVGTTDEIVTVASGDQVKVGLAQAVKDNIDNKANKDLSNLTPTGIDKIKDTAAWKVKANNNTAETVKGGDEVVFKDGAGVKITQSGKEFTISADTSKISQGTKLSYTANGDAPKQEVTLADGLNFKNGNFTTATVGANGEVKYDTVTQGLTVTDGKAGLPNPATPGATTPNGLVTAQDVADALNSVGWKATADATGTGIKTGTPSAQLVKNGSTVSYVAGNNLTVAQDVDANGNHKYTYSLNKDLTGLDSVTTKTITIPGATPGTNDVVIGKDGISAGNKVIKDVAPGVNGTDAVNKNQLDTATNDLINKGMNFSADDYDPATANTTVSKKLGERLEIVGGADKTKLSDNNIGSVVDNTGKINVKLAKELKDLTSAEFKTPAGDKTVINGDGLTVTPAAPGAAPISVTKDGINAGNKKITNVAPGTISKTSTDAINGSQLYNLASNTIQLGGDNASTTDKQTLDKTGGIKFDIVGANGITTEAKDGKVTVKVDSSTIGTNSKLKYTANGDAPKQEVTLADGLNFKNGNFTTATVGANGEVKYDTVTQSLNVSPDGKAGLPNPATPGATTPNGLVTAQDVADALNNVGWNATADATGTGIKTGTPSAQLVKNGSTVSYVAGDNLTVAQDVTAGDHKYTYSLNKVLKDLTSAEFKTPAGDKTVINGDGLTVSPATPTTSPISVTKDGISAGDKKVTNVAPGTISKTSTDAINGSQLYNLASNTIQLGGDKATTTDKQTLDKSGGIKFDIVGANGITTEAKDGKVTVSVDTSTIGANTKLKYKSNSDTATAQEVKLSDGLDFKNGNFTTATVGANGEVKYDTVTQGLTVTDGKASLPNPATPGATTPNGLVTAQDVADALNNVGWKATADATGTGEKTGTPSAQLVKNGSTVSYVAGDNLTVAQDVTAGDHKYTYSLNKVLKDLTSAEFKTPAGDKTVINGDGLTVNPATPGTAPISITKDGISAGDKVVKNVAPGTISSTSTDAINGSQFHKLATNTIQLGGDNATTTATQQLDKAGGIKFDIVGANGITTEAKDGKVTVKVDAATIGANTKLKYKSNSDAATSQEVKLADGLDFKNGNFTTASVGANGEVKYDTVTQGLAVGPDGKASLPNPATPGATTPNGLVTAQDVADALNSVGWKATADATGTGIKTGTPSAQLVKNGSTVSYVAGDNLTVAQDVTAGDHKYTYSLNKVLKDLTSAEFKTPAGDKTVINGDGLTVSPATPGTAPISITKDGISAGDKVVKNVAPGTISSTSTDAINGSQFHKLATNTIQLGGDNATTTATQQLDKNGGIKFNIVGENGITTKATGDKVSIGVDTSTIGANIKLKYKSNSDAATTQEVKLSDGLDFKNGNFTTATVGANGEVKYDTVTQGLSVSPDGKAGLPNPATPGATTPNGLVTAQDVANALNSVGWNATADATGTGVKTGTPSAQLVKNGSTVSYVAGDNLAVEQNVDANGNHKYTYSLNKQLKDLTSAEFVNPTSGNKTVVNGDGLTITPSTPGAKNISITKDGISAGDKKITDVADGDITPTSKDAINGSQLYKLASNTISLGGDNSTVTATQQLNKNGGIKFNIVGDNGIITEAKDDKVIVRVNPSTIGSNITLKYAANGANDQTVKLSDGLNFQDGNFTKASVDAQGKVKYDTVTQAIAPTADGKAQVAPGSTPGLATSADVVNAINNSGWKATAGGNVTGTATPTLVKNGQEVEFNAGDNLKVKQTIDPTTGKQTYEYSLNKDLTGLNSAEFTNAAGDKTKITAGNTEYTNAAGDKTVVNADGLTISSSTPGAKDISVTKDGISAGDKVIKNVAAGVNDTDAVNVSQLKDVDNKITNVNNTINKGLNFKGNTGATVNKQLGDTLEIVGEGTKADSEYSGQNLKVVEDNGKLVVKMDKNLKSDTVTADAVNTNSVTVGAPGKDGVITVKDANGKDGVSINGKDGSIGLNGKDGSSATISTVQGNPGVNGTPGTTMDRIQYTDNSGTPHQVATLDDGMKYGGDTGAVINKKLNQQVNVVGGITDVTKLAANDNIGVVSDGSNNLKVRLAKDLDGLETVTVRDASGNTTVVKGDGVTITSPSGNTVSLSNQGLDNGGNVITNVAAGKDGTDAVNVDQLNQTVGNVVNAAGDAIAHVNNKVDKLGDRVNKGLAGAAAMAGLEFMDIGINQATVAAAVGGYRGTHAVAVGVQAAPTENTRINAKVSMTPGSRSETMYSVGASYRFNWR
ncbi:YadA-like family protein [Fusobacterium pseudoperiodonticum]|uniref:YadA-like family protein n=1 Tax=Fusobacterium pseudoperiodonticum TaxID=2663009 RepID=UPI0018858B10|nr:YadA-like family protein [Fusobacterium pseudoperiodonticum]